MISRITSDEVRRFDRIADEPSDLLIIAIVCSILGIALKELEGLAL
ncbi:hypothetical protein [Caballeronia sp. S22]